MTPRTTRLFCLTLLNACLLAACTAAAPAAEQKLHFFRVKIVSDLEMTLQGQDKQVLKAESGLVYSWDRSTPYHVLKFKGVLVKADINGVPTIDTVMTREKLTITEQGRKSDVLATSAPPDLKTMLEGSFGVPICRRKFDQNGREVNRTIVAGPGAKKLIDNGVVANAIVFHAPFLLDEQEWDADNEVSLGNGGYAKGTLHYKKVTGGKGGQAVKVTGTLANDSFLQPGTPLTLKNARLVINGEQTYDTARHEWISGKLPIDLTYDMSVNDKIIGSTKGSMVLTLELMPDLK